MYSKTKRTVNRTRIHNNSTNKNDCFDEYEPIKKACLALLCRDCIKNVKKTKNSKRKIYEQRALRRLFLNGLNGMFDSGFTTNILFKLDMKLKGENNETI